MLFSCAKTIVSWKIDGRALEEAAAWSPHTDPINAIRWCPAGDAVASCSDDGTVVLSSFDGATVEKISPRRSDGSALLSPIHALSVQSSGRHMAFGGSSRKLYIWDLKTATMHKTFSGHSDTITAVAFSPNDSFIASSSFSGDIVLHSLTTNTTTGTLKTDSGQPASALKAIDFSVFQKSLFATGGEDGHISLWDSVSRKRQMNLCPHLAPVSAVAFSTVNKYLLASAGLDRKICFTDVVERKKVKEIVCDGPLTSLAFHSDGHTIAVGTLTGRLFLFDLRKAQEPFAKKLGHDGEPITSLCFRPNTSKPVGGRLSLGSKNQPSSLRGLRKETATSNNRPSAAPQPSQTAPENNTDIFSPIADRGNKATSSTLDANKYRSEDGFDKGLSGRLSPRDILKGIDSRPSAGERGTHTPSLNASKVLTNTEASLLESRREMDSNSSNRAARTSVEESERTRSIPSGTPAVESPRFKGGKDAPASKETQEVNSVAGGGFAFQTNLLSSMLDESLTSFRRSMKNDIETLHVEMLRQFHIQHLEMRKMLESFATRHSDMERRIQELEEENYRLRSGINDVRR